MVRERTFRIPHTAVQVSPRGAVVCSQGHKPLEGAVRGKASPNGAKDGLRRVRLCRPSGAERHVIAVTRGLRPWVQTFAPAGLLGAALRARTFIAGLAILLIALLPTSLLGAPPDEAEPGPGVGLTVYNQDFAIIRERRNMALAAGRSEVKFKDVAATIVPETVHFRSLQPAGDAAVLEQNYEFDLVNASKLLDKYIDGSIRIVTRDGDLLDGKLMSFDDEQLVLDAKDGIQLVPRGKNVKDICFSELPGGLLTKPTLVWQVRAKQGGDHLMEVAYRANGVNWRVDYRAVADADGKALDLSGWVTIDNRSGMTYRDAHLKLMAGDVHVVDESRLRERLGGIEDEGRASYDAKSSKGFEEKAFAEYHLYALPRPTTIKEAQTKQIELIDVESVPVTRAYEYRGEGDKVRVVLEFKNDKKTSEGLGIPLPKGPIRVYQHDADGQAEFLGMDSIDHTPKDELVKVKVGYAFDIKGERTQTATRRPSPRVEEQDWRVRVRNHMDTAVRVEILESLRPQTWEILKTSQEYTKKDYRTIAYDVNVPANGETVVTYTVRYSW
jgi:hypothetical protein